MTQRLRPQLFSSQLPAWLSRRQFVHGLSLGLGTSLVVGRAAAQTNQPSPSAKPATAPQAKVLLMRPSGNLELNTRTKIVLELSGSLRVDEAESKSPAAATEATPAAKPIELKGKSTLDYFEKIALSSSSSDAASLVQPHGESGALPEPQPRPHGSVAAAAERHYNEAQAETWISGKSSTNKLRPDCVKTRLLPHHGLWQQYCEARPLSSHEVQLLHSPVDSSSLELLLPLQPARADSSWEIAADSAQRLFNLDAVHSSTLVAKISKVEQGVATVLLKGELDATANSVPTRLQIDGNFQVKLASQCALVTWLGVVIKEVRQVSQAEPGFDITARVRLIRDETEPKIATTADALRGLAASDDAGRWLVQLKSVAGRYSMLADRRWHVHRDSPEEAILRMVENNTVIAQCSVNRLAELEAGQQLTMEGLQADIRTLLGTGFGEFLESAEKVTSNNLRMMRIVVTGELEQVPIQWVYTHLSDDSGRRLALVFTMGGTVTDRFGAADDQLADSFQWLPDLPKPPSSSDATSEPPKQTAASQRAAAQR